MGCAKGLDGPDLHLSEALSTKLSLTTERLLGNHTVRTNGAGVHLVLDHVAELQEVSDAHRGRLVEALTRLAIVDIGGAEVGESGLVGPLLQVLQLGTVEDRGGKLHAQALSCGAEDSLEDLSEVHT